MIVCLHMRNVQIIHYHEFVGVSIFDDGRFDLGASNISYFQNITCLNTNIPSISDCSIFDKCQSSCSNPKSLKCWSEL